MKRSGAGIFCIQFSNAYKAKTAPLVVVGKPYDSLEYPAASVSLDEILGSNDCARLNGAERWPLEAVLIHKNTGWVKSPFNS